MNFLATKGIEPQRLPTVKPSHKQKVKHTNPHNKTSVDKTLTEEGQRLRKEVTA
jgi:hypothetical protein